MTTTLIPIVTNTGLEALINTQNQGLNATITEIGLGDTSWTPEGNATALKSEKRRIPILGGERINETQIHMTAVEDGTEIEYWVRELGFYLADGTLLAIWSHATQALAYKTATVDLLLALDLSLSTLPANSVNVDGKPGFTMPFARTDKEGIVRLATEAEASSGTLNSAVALTPKANQTHGDNRYAQKSHRHPWNEIDSKPASYTPSSHRHNWSELDSKPATYPPDSHRHDWNQLDNKPANYAPSSHRHNWNELDSKPASYTPSSHRHNWNELDGKPGSYTPASHNHDSLYLKRAEFRIMAPAGAVMAFATQNLPGGWLECDGSPLSRTAYADLYAAIGTTYGYTNSSDFRLPDLRGEFVRGWDHGRGVDNGRGFGGWQGDEFRSHYHGLNWWASGGATLPNTYPGFANSYNPKPNQGSAKGTSNRGGSETRPRNLALMYCIKY